MDTPTIIDKFLPTPKWNHNRFDPQLGIHARPRFIVIHVQEGTSEHSWNHHAFVAKASATVFANRDGTIWRCVPEQHGPWTNGDTCDSTADGWRLRNLGGDPNNWSLTIETEGFSSHRPDSLGRIAPTEPQFQSVVWQVRTWMDRYDIPVENVIRHADVNMCTRDFCPGNPYFQRLRTELQAAVSVQPAAPPPPEFNGLDVVINGRTFHAVPSTQQRQKVKTDVLRRRKWAESSAPELGPPLARGEEFIANYWVEGQEVNDESRWWVAQDGARLWCGGTDKTPDDL